MKVEIRSDGVHISGYVNAVDRYSRVLKDKNGRRFREKILPGAFSRSMKRCPDVKVMFNHVRALTQVNTDGITLKADNLGLYFDGYIRDKEVIERARAGKLVGWSFGFTLGEHTDTPSGCDEYDFERAVKELGLFEISIIDDRYNPCYEATSLQARAEAEAFVRACDEKPEITEISSENFAAKNALRKRRLDIKKRK